MKTAQDKIDISKLTTDDLEAALKEKKEKELKEAQEKRDTYEYNKSLLIGTISIMAQDISDLIASLKKEAFEKLEAFRLLMLEYGDIKGGENNKGNFEIKNNHFKIIYCSQEKKEFDEKAIMAEVKLKEFLSGFVKKRDKELYGLVMGLLERNAVTGALDISNINRLYKLEDKFDDQNWKDAIRLFKESYNPSGTARYIRFYKKNQNNGWDLINLNFSSI